MKRLLVLLAMAAALLVARGEAEACTALPATGCTPALIRTDTTQVPQNAPALLYVGSADLSGAFEGGPSEVRLFAPDGGEIPASAADGVVQALAPLEAGAGYRVSVQEKCVDGGWEPASAAVIEAAVEVVAPYPEPTALGELDLKAPATTTTRTSTYTAADCSHPVVEERVAEVELHFTPDASLAPWFSRMSLQVFVDGAPKTALSGTTSAGHDIVLSGRCDVASELGDHVAKLRATVAGLGELPYTLEVPYRLECDALAPERASGCTAVAGSGSALALLALGWAVRSRRTPRGTTARRFAG